MNLSSYIFGSLGYGYVQYPNDYSQSILHHFISSPSTATTQLVVHRENEIMYYGYIRKLYEQRYIGLCIVVNGIMLTDFKEIFSIFENAITNIVAKGIVLQFNNKGEIVSQINQLYTEQNELNRITRLLRNEFSSPNLKSKCLPPISYGISPNQRQTFLINDPIDAIEKSTYTYGYTYIAKEEGYNTEALNSYSAILSRLNKENTDLKQQNDVLHANNENILRQKKQFKNVMILSMILVVCCIGLYLLYINLNNTQGQLDDANGRIANKNRIIKDNEEKIELLNSRIDSLTTVYTTTYNQKLIAEQQLANICSFLPFAVTSSEITGSYIRYDYYAIEDKEITVTLRAINEESDEVIVNNFNITVHEGKGSQTLYFNYDLDSSCYYTVSLLYKGVIIAGGRW